MKKRLLKVVLGMLIGFAVGAEARTQDVQNAVVKIYTVHSMPDYYMPWGSYANYSSTGSGAVIKEKRILTNAHVVHDQAMIQVRRNGDSRRYRARVLFVSHAADLAVLTVDDADFFEGIEPLELGVLPEKQSEVGVYGFPVGGDMLSITEGIVSRVEHQSYSHSDCALLAIQIDAAINPGNSGGPAIAEGQVVGVAMQGLNGADDVGYIIPPSVIQQFLTDIEDGSYAGTPVLGISYQRMENPGMRRFYGMADEQSGVLITSVARDAASGGILNEGDVLLSINGHPVENDATVEFRPDERTHFKYYMESLQMGEVLKVGILRNRKPMDLDIPLTSPFGQGMLVSPVQYETPPSYYVYGGLVFAPFTRSLFNNLGEDALFWVASLLPRLREFSTDEVDEVVILQRVLATDVNEGYHNMGLVQVETVNGQKVKNLKHLVELIETEAGKEFVELGLFGGKKIVLNRNRVAESAFSVLADYQVTKDRSDDLLKPVVE